MLEPNSRRLLMESLQPPAEYRLDWAVGTTYTLDLLAILSAPVAFAFSDWQDRDGRPTADPLALLKAVRQYAGRICLFCQAGKIHVPKTYLPLLASLEGSIVEANAPLGGSFHPKLWFLRFVGEDDVVIYRVLCLSRNMTFDRSWDTLLCLDGILRDRTNAFGKNHPLGRFAESLPQMSTRKIAPTWKRRIQQLAYEIRRVEFEVPEPFEDLRFWPLGINGSNRWPFPERMDRILVVSPFVDDGLADDLTEWKAPMQLLSRVESLARLKPSTLEHFEKVWILDDTANPEPGEMEEEAQPDTNGQSDAPSNDDIPLVGLHAKVYVADDGWNASIFTGSANATRAAFNRNVEFLIELRGKRSRCGVAATLGESNSDDKKRASHLVDLLQAYRRCDDDLEVNKEVEQFERLVDTIAKDLAACAPVASCIALAEPNSFSIRLRPTKPIKRKPRHKCALTARPISVPSAQFQTVDLSQSCWAEFARVSLLGLTSFFVFEVESENKKLQRRFVLNIPLENAPENRHESILRDLLSDRDRVLRFLLLLLLDTGARDLNKLFEPTGNGQGTFGFVHSMFNATLFESLVRALDREPERIDQVAQVIDDLRGAHEGRELLPDDLDSIWVPIWSVRQKQIERANKAQNKRGRSSAQRVR